MPSASAITDHPVVLEILAGGGIVGGTRHYEKTLGDMAGVYSDDSAWKAAVALHGAKHLVYFVDEQKYQDGTGALTIGTSTLLPGTYGTEFAVTRGHLHTISDRAELYYCLSLDAPMGCGRWDCALNGVSGLTRRA